VSSAHGRCRKTAHTGGTQAPACSMTVTRYRAWRSVNPLFATTWTDDPRHAFALALPRFVDSILKSTELPDALRFASAARRVSALSSTTNSLWDDLATGPSDCEHFEQKQRTERAGSSTHFGPRSWRSVLSGAHGILEPVSGGLPLVGCSGMLARFAT
jgi:hypothetical protein